MNKTFPPMLARRWLRLQNIPFVVGLTKNQAKESGQDLGSLGEGVYAVSPTDQSPVSKGSMMGKLLADRIVGADSPLLREMLSLLDPAAGPNHALHGTPGGGAGDAGSRPRIAAAGNHSLKLE